MEEDGVKPISRRNFLAIATWAMGGLISIGIGIPAIGYLIGPALKQENKKEWIRVSSASKVEVGTPTLFKVKINRQVGWTVNEEELAVYILTTNGRDFIALSNICTHLGCRIRWISDKEQFFCPCHNGIFNKDGQVVSGPPPKPLDRFEIKVEDDQLFIMGG
jgi:menaquinol-cytochrome c reductase iron-sulfur subunit